MDLCSDCEGTGWLVTIFQSADGDPPEREGDPCPSCDGTGMLPESEKP